MEHVLEIQAWSLLEVEDEEARRAEREAAHRRKANKDAINRTQHIAGR